MIVPIQWSQHIHLVHPHPQYPSCSLNTRVHPSTGSWFWSQLIKIDEMIIWGIQQLQVLIWSLGLSFPSLDHGWEPPTLSSSEFKSRIHISVSPHHSHVRFPISSKQVQSQAHLPFFDSLLFTWNIQNTYVPLLAAVHFSLRLIPWASISTRFYSMQCNLFCLHLTKHGEHQEILILERKNLN